MSSKLQPNSVCVLICKCGLTVYMETSWNMHFILYIYVYTFKMYNRHTSCKDGPLAVTSRVIALICRVLLFNPSETQLFSAIKKGVPWPYLTIGSGSSQTHRVFCFWIHRSTIIGFLRVRVVIPIIFPKVPQSSRPQSSRFPSYPLPLDTPGPLPLSSMYGLFTYIYHKTQPNGLANIPVLWMLWVKVPGS